MSSHPVRCCMLLLGVAVVAAQDLAAASREPSTIAQAARASVFIKVERRYRGMEITSSGSGFFVNPDGYVLTNRHVVGETVEGHLWGEAREINVTIVGISVVVEVGTEAERELPAKVFAEDRKRDLALLKVGYRPAFYLAPKQDMVPDITDEVWVIGYPFGSLLSIDARGGPASGGNPEPSINMGRVTSIRRDQERNVVAIQTDAAINPGNSGGPMLSASAELLGVVYAGIAGGDQVGFAISPNRVWDFVVNQSIRVRFKPPYVFTSRTPIKLTLSAGMYEIAARRGTARLEGSDIETTEIDLEKVDNVWQGVLQIPEFHPDLPKAESYEVTVRMYGNGRRTVYERRFLLERRATNAAVLASDRSAAATMRDRGLLANRLSIADYAKKQESEEEADRSVDTLIEAPSQVEQPYAIPQRAEETGDSDSNGTSTGNTADEGSPAGAQAEMTELLMERGRELMRQESYDSAAVMFEEVLRLDPDNQLAGTYLDLARNRTGGGVPDGETAGAPPVPEPVATTANLTIRFDTTLNSGTIRVSVDGTPAQELAFDFGRKGGRVLETMTVPSGRHSLTASLHQGGDTLGEKTFSEYFDEDSEWTLRITLHKKAERPGFFLVARR